MLAKDADVRRDQGRMMMMMTKNITTRCGAAKPRDVLQRWYKIRSHEKGQYLVPSVHNEGKKEEYL